MEGSQHTAYSSFQSLVRLRDISVSSSETLLAVDNRSHASLDRVSRRDTSVRSALMVDVHCLRSYNEAEAKNKATGRAQSGPGTVL